jgi:hypothetical protein
VAPYVAASGAEAIPGKRAARARKERVLLPKPKESPYAGVPVEAFADRTRALIDEYPVPPDEFSRIVLDSWDQLLESAIGGFRIGVDIFPSPQAMGSLLHELIPLTMGRAYPGKWRRVCNAGEKDIVCVFNDHFSTEIKTSSSAQQIFGNRSFAQLVDMGAKKAKSGYYLAVNFAKFPAQLEAGPVDKPSIQSIRFGWLDHTDWTGQAKESGQQSALAPIIEDSQLLAIYLKE